MALFPHNNRSVVDGTAVLTLSRIRDSRDAFLSVDAFFQTALSRLSQLGPAQADSEDLAESTRGLYRMMLEDPALKSAVSALAEAHQCSPAEAFGLHLETLMTEWKRNGDYFAQRAYDLEDLRYLVSVPKDDFSKNAFPRDAILILPALLTSELMGLDWSCVRVVIAGRGGENSHPAILLRSQGVPLVILNREISGVRTGDRMKIDFCRGTIYVGDSLWNHWTLPASGAETVEFPENLEIWPCISTPDEARELNMEAFSGIGLVRTEMSPILSGKMPTQKEMETEYETILLHANGKPVRFRLWDFEPDKPAPGFPPGIWGMDFLLKNSEWTRKQVSVLLRLSFHYPLGMILPMVRSRSEVYEFSNLLRNIKHEIWGSNPTEWPVVPLGAMIETREMVEIASQIPDLDYWIIGTNDLLCSFSGECRADGSFPAESFWNSDFVDLIASVSRRAEEMKIPLSLCGEGANLIRAVVRYAEKGIRVFCPSPAGLSAYPGYACNK